MVFSVFSNTMLKNSFQKQEQTGPKNFFLFIGKISVLNSI